MSVAQIPFKPPSILYNISTYNINDPEALMNQKYTPISAPAFFLLMFVTLKFIVRKLFFASHERFEQSNMFGLSIPKKMIMNNRSSVTSSQTMWDHFDLLTSFLGMIFSVLCQIYSFYKMLKKYDDLKYVVSITRNVSRMTGFMCSLWLPKPLRYVFYGGFAKFYGINMEEVEEPDFGHYETFTKFFTRNLKEGVRTVSEPKNAKSMCSPCDGKVLTCGKINSEYSTIDCVKGRSYRLDEFMLGTLGDSD